MQFNPFNLARASRLCTFKAIRTNTKQLQ